MTQGCFMIRVLFLFLLIGFSGSMYASRPKIASAGEGSAFKKELEKSDLPKDKKLGINLQEKVSFVQTDGKGKWNRRYTTSLSWYFPESWGKNVELDLSVSNFRPSIEEIQSGCWTQRQKLRFDEVNLSLSKELQVHNKFFIKPFWGLDYIFSKRESQYFRGKDRFLDQKPSRISMFGSGLLFGVETIAKYPYSLSLITNLSCSLIYQRTSVKDFYRMSIYEKETVVPKANIYLGIGWETTKFLGEKLSLRAGYEMYRCFDQFVFSNRYMEHALTTFCLRGFSIRAKIDF